MCTRLPQQREGQKFFFSGKLRISKRVSELLSPEEILLIYREIQELVSNNSGLDFLQIYIDNQQRQIFFVDYLDERTLLSGNYDPENHFCTLKFNYEC
jgi:hypothetical protein